MCGSGNCQIHKSRLRKGICLHGGSNDDGGKESAVNFRGLEGEGKIDFFFMLSQQLTTSCQSSWPGEQVPHAEKEQNAEDES